MNSIRIVRHAESTSNIGEPTESPKSIMLSATGQKQAQLLADNRTDDVDVIIHSLYDRTYETVKPLIHKYPGAEIIQSQLIHEFTYLDPEKYKNTTFAQREPWKNKFREIEDMDYKADHNTESVADFMKRITGFIAYLKSLESTYHDKNIVIASHGQYIRMLVDVLQTPNYELGNDTKKRIYQRFLDKDTEIKNTQIVDLTNLIK